MTRRRRTLKEAEHVKLLLADIIQDTFDNNGPVITHEELARRHVLRNGSVSAAEDVHLYGGRAVAYLRNELKYAIVPITAKFTEFTPETNDEAIISSAVAGLGAGGPRIGWYQPRDRDDWLWVYFMGHLAHAGVMAIYHVEEPNRNNPKLLGAKGRAHIADRAADALPTPGRVERKVLEARLGA